MAVLTLAVSSVRLDSATADEGAHIAAGLVKLRHGWLSYFPDQQPLMNALSALPLGAFRLPDVWQRDLGPGGHWRAGHAVLYGAGNDAHRLLFLARLPTIALLLALCFAVYAVVKREAGRGWAVVAFALTGFCPNLLAHGRLATVDMAVTAFGFAAFAYLMGTLGRLSRAPSSGLRPPSPRMRGEGQRAEEERGEERHAGGTESRNVSIVAPLPAGRGEGGRRPGEGRELRSNAATGLLPPALCGLFTACAMLSKTTGALFVPFFALVVAWHVWRTREWRTLVAPMFAALAAAVVTLYVVTFALAGDEYLNAHYASTPKILVPWLEYKLHVDSLRQTAQHENPQFLLGEFSRRGWPHYYLVAFLLKTPLAAILLLVLAAVAARRRRSLALHASLQFVVLFAGVLSTTHAAIGIRHILPIYPFLYAAIAIALSSVVTDRRREIAVGVLMAWHCVSSLIAYPSYLSYFNELIGSQRNADRFLIDSNLDWGQDLRRLRLWADANGVDAIRVDYFGGGEPAYELGPRAERWPAPRRQLLPKGWFALSRHFYRVSFDPTQSPIAYDEYLAASRARYVTTVGGSIDVYRVD